MVIRKLEKKEIPSIEDIINRGGDVAHEKKSGAGTKEWIYINLRIRKDLADGMEKMLEDRVGMSRTSWILEAIQEKIKKDLREIE